MEESLRYFGSRVDAMIKGSNLTREEASFLFKQILNNEQPDLQQGAFLVAITAKGATAQEIAGIWEAIYEIDTVHVHPDVKGLWWRTAARAWTASRPSTSAPPPRWWQQPTA